jgi:hypothetical protein
MVSLHRGVPCEGLARRAEACRRAPGGSASRPRSGCSCPVTAFCPSPYNSPSSCRSVMYLTIIGAVTCGMSLSEPIFASYTAAWNRSVGAIDPGIGRLPDTCARTHADAAKHLGDQPDHGGHCCPPGFATYLPGPAEGRSAFHSVQTLRFSDLSIHACFSSELTISCRRSLVLGSTASTASWTVRMVLTAA